MRSVQGTLFVGDRLGSSILLLLGGNASLSGARFPIRQLINSDKGTEYSVSWPGLDFDGWISISSGGGVDGEATTRVVLMQSSYVHANHTSMVGGCSSKGYIYIVLASRPVNQLLELVYF